MAPKNLYIVAQFNPAVHRRDDFNCESRDLTEFLQKRARKEMAALASACFVICPKDDPTWIAGYYTLSAAEIELDQLPSELLKKLPGYPLLPATLLGRLARDSAFKGKGLGDLLMADAMRRTLAGSSQIGSVAIVTDPKDERAAGFYADFGFRKLVGKRLFLPMKEVGKWTEPKQG